MVLSASANHHLSLINYNCRFEMSGLTGARPLALHELGACGDTLAAPLRCHEAGQGGRK